MDGFRERRRATAWLQQGRTGEDSTSGPAIERATTHGVFAALGDAGTQALHAGKVHRFVAGVDQRVRPLSAQELTALGDPMATLLFRQGKFPMTVQDLLSELPQSTTPGSQAVYLISEAGQIPPAAAPDLPRDMRFAIARAATSRDVDLLVSTGANGDPATTFLQVAAWDEAAGVFNYYMRIDPVWIWAGNSWSSLTTGSRGNGCFDSHINGSVVMKELKLPWINWQSQAATIQLAPDDTLRDNPLYKHVIGAQNLELTVRSLISRWTAARLAAVTQGGTLRHPEQLMRHLFTSTAVNLASTATQSSTITPADGDLALPTGFWLNSDALLDDLQLPVSASLPLAPATHYIASLTKFDFRLEEKTNGFSQPGDTFFAFVVPEAACEDNDVVQQMVQQGIITAKFAACALMVDFTNPVFSPDRAQLMTYVPTTATETAGLQDKIVQAIVEAAASLPPSSPESRFAADWALADSAWPNAFANRIDDYLGRVSKLISMSSGFDDYVRLAESRRREFKVMRLNEFELTLPTTNIPEHAPRLRMNDDGTVVPRP
ncbi:hypothetical protein E5082_31920 [Streptomyces griseoluteus]|uniref:Uncharacterized protein n=1 Tax=Streptomyces griseoluteus TaxID=29306 RepID=A0A4Z1CWT1_STRGP|nr:hypothetical protein [Streptomyces griseoluteus]TGN73445.1 hypothetical protein E5082_31920 [Streptomyces griseoluteus]GHF33210.1 hypothetical protein GCM10017776_59640 [Streptomyces griseoluteus]